MRYLHLPSSKTVATIDLDQADNDTDPAHQRYDALCALCALPDAADLPPRGNHCTCSGNAAAKDRVKRELAGAYVAYRMQQRGEEATIVSVRRSPLQLVRRRA
jgi:hypothetical protein